jgi:hypothetical protein
LAGRQREKRGKIPETTVLWPKKANLSKKRSGRRSGDRKQDKTDLEYVISDFVACGRCSFFLAGYRIMHGDSGLDSAAADSAADETDRDWLQLIWDAQTRRLVQDSYGNPLDVALDYLDSRCPECRRRFIYRAAENEDEDDKFQIELVGD